MNAQKVFSRSANCIIDKRAVMYRQSDVDDATMRIEDPARVRGSGFIQFPPQRPFEQAVIVQPATVAHFNHEVPYPSVQKKVPTVKHTLPAHARGDQYNTRPLVSSNTMTTGKQPLNTKPLSTQAGSEVKLSKAQARRRRKKIRDAGSGRTTG